LHSVHEEDSIRVKIDQAIRVALLTAGKDPHYALGLLSGLTTERIIIDFIANDEMQKSPIIELPNVNYFNLRGDQDERSSPYDKARRVLKYYVKLFSYAATSESKVFHILWLNKFTYFDGSLLNVYYKILGKKLIYTAHNINIWERDQQDSYFKKLFLKLMYGMMDHIFVHTSRMKQQLVTSYSVEENKISVIPFGINNVIPKSSMSKSQARDCLQIQRDDRIILFFGNIAPYKGLDDLVKALSIVKNKLPGLRLIIAGRIKGAESYWKEIELIIEQYNLSQDIIIKLEYIPDEEVEVYLKSADVLILPYRHIFQSGVVFLSYNFGLPIIATDVGSLAEEIIEGQMGFICKPDDPQDLANAIIKYFESSLYENLESQRETIIEHANKKYSWRNIGNITYKIYKKLLM
jgi:D-inositol-3-phosphate glycosyltransferase